MQSFEELTAPYRRELHLHCYRMLGSFTDADDLLQETLLAAWRGLPAFDERSSLRTWLYKIATNRCLNAIRDSKRRPPAEPLPPFDPPEPTSRGDVTWLQPYPMRCSTISWSSARTSSSPSSPHSSGCPRVRRPP
jgi:RNA polymerase sigma-70 factor (ECF subfamily)